MFGYILPSLDSLEDEEKQRYKAVYCGVCRSIRQRYGQRSRLTVSYDMTFMALVLGSLYEPEETQGSKRCPVHPVQPQDFARNEFTDYAADMSIALAYHKCLDDWRDDHSAPARAAAAALSGPYKRAKERRPQQCAAIEYAMEDIHVLEEAALAYASAQTGAAVNSAQPDSSGAPSSTTPSEPPTPDAAANRFGLLLGDLFAYQDDFWATDLRRFGARLGKFVYVMDAAMDLEEDRSTGNYNPFVLMDANSHDIEEDLELLAASMADAFERLPLERDVHVLRSVLYAGVWARYKQKESKEHNG